MIGASEDRYKYNILSGLYICAVLIPTIAVLFRRLQDVGVSGWIILFFLLIPFISPILLFICLRDSNPGENQYGPNPKEIADS